MKKILFILALLLVTNFASAAWSEPSGTPPANNVPAPINVGNLQQNKTGKIGATAFCLPGGGYADCAGAGAGGNGWAGFIKNIIFGSATGGGIQGSLAQWGPGNTLTQGPLASSMLTGGGVGGSLALWLGSGPSSTLTDSGITKAQLDGAVAGGYWRAGGVGIVTTGSIIDGANGLRVQVGVPSSPQIGQIWLEN